MTTATMAVRRNQNLYRSQAEWRLGPVSASLVIVAVIAVLALIYLQQVTKTSVFGYQLSELKQERTEAIAAKQELEVEAARLTSIQEIQKSQAVAGLVSSGQVTYAK